MTIRNLLFIRTDRMGDVLMNLPALGLLRATFPQARIALMLDRSVIELLERCADIDEIIPIDANALKKSWTARFTLAKQLRAGGFDTVLISNPDRWLHLVSFLAGIPMRIGYDRKWGFLLTRKIDDRKYDNAKHEIESNLDLVRMISDKTWSGGYAIPVDEQAAQTVETRLSQDCPGPKRIIAVHPGTSNPKKRWALERFAQLCDGLSSGQNAWVVLIGGAEEQTIASELCRLTNIKPVDWTGALTLKELAAFLSHPRTGVLVSSDSGPVHIAWMSGTPVVVLFAHDVEGAHPNRWRPLTNLCTVIHKPMAEITVEEVKLAVGTWLQERSVQSAARAQS